MTVADSDGRPLLRIDAHSEYRMGMSFYSVVGLRIEGLTVEFTGGDGLYLENDYDVAVTGCRFLNNYR